jgi:SAM-dependent methyltransferase
MDAPAVDDGLPFTGERFVPGTPGEIWIEHWHRYHFAARWAAGKRVLDVACGEGYGSAFLARTAAHVTGVDVSGQAIAHAQQAYAKPGAVEFVQASCARLPFPDASFDVAVSFETLEHIEGQAQFLDELARVLGPAGVLVLSCPNKLEYSDKRGFTNEFHVKELYRDELRELVAARFPECAWYGHRATFYSVIAPEADGVAAGAHVVEVDAERPGEAARHLAHPLYFMLVASRERTAVDAPGAALSVLADRGDWVYHDYEKAYRDMRAAAGRADALQREAQALGAEDIALREQLREAHALRAALEAALDQRAAALAARDAELLARDLQLSEKNREIDRRRGWRWWLRLPLIRLGFLK